MAPSPILLHSLFLAAFTLASADAPDRLISVIAYFYPFFDGVQYGKYVITQFFPFQVFIQPLVPAIRVFKSFPFNGFLVFLTLYFVVVRNPNFSRESQAQEAHRQGACRQDRHRPHRRSLRRICAGLSFRSLLAGGTFEPAAGTRDPLQTSKIEPLFTTNERTAGEAPLYNFFSEAASSSPRHQLPGLRFFELPQNTAAVDSPVPNLRFEADSYGNPRRKRRQPYKMSDKTRCLRKLLPGNGKMDMATVLEEAYKYIKFLQAQVGVLRLMPCQSNAAVGGSAASIVGTDLGRLNRQQLLQVVTNSPAAQAQICAEGCCVYSAEQVVLLEKIAEQEALI